MPELFIELFSEEIPARLQARGAVELLRLVSEGLAALAPSGLRQVFGARRIALAAEVAQQVAALSSVERGPRVAAPEQAIAGFLRKFGATRADLREEGGFWVLDRTSPAVDAATLIASVMPVLLRRFAWPKSMRWGGASTFTWIRPLRRIVCLLDGAVVPFSLATEGDDGHGLASGGLTEGHRFHAPGPVAVTGLENWKAVLLAHCVVPDPVERERLIRDGIAGLARARGLSVVDDPGLVEEVAGLVEWPVPLLGRIDDAFMDLPPEVMQVSMRVNQRYFALHDTEGLAAPWFAFAANVEAADGGAAIVAGNERVLRARFSDARHFWDLDRRTRLADRVAALDGMIFQAELGSQGERVRRLVRLAGAIAPLLGVEVGLAERAALLCKADLTTGMVGEFPELQGVMGGYYAVHDGEDGCVADAVRDHYAPKGPSDAVPSAGATVAIALADKLDQLASFFSVDLGPKGSGDPYGLRRAALGILRLIRDNGIRVDLSSLVSIALQPLTPRIRLDPQPRALTAPPDDDVRRLLLAPGIIDFLLERLRGLVEIDGIRADVFRAAFQPHKPRYDTGLDIVRAISLCSALSTFLSSSDGVNLLAAYKRGSNILRIENRRDGPHDGAVEPALLKEPAEQALFKSLQDARHADELLAIELFSGAMTVLARLRAPLDAFFEDVTVNAEDAALRTNRLRLLNSLRDSLNRVADFSALEG